MRSKKKFSVDIKANLRSPNPVRNKTPEVSVLSSTRISNGAKGDLFLTGFTPLEIKGQVYTL